MIQAPPSQGSVTSMNQALGVRTTKFLGIMLIVSGLLMCGIQTVCTIIVEQEDIYHSSHQAGTGIWCGVIVFISGVLGLQTARRKTNALVGII